MDDHEGYQGDNAPADNAVIWTQVNMEQARTQQALTAIADSIEARLDRPAQPLQDNMLPELSAPALAALRSTNHDFKSLVDSASGQAWGPAMRPVLPPEIIQYAADGTAMQTMLRSQAWVLRELRSSASSCRMHCFATLSQAAAVEVRWSPGWPSRYIAVLTKIEKSLIRDMAAAPADSGPAWLLDTSTWTALPGFKTGWDCPTLQTLSNTPGKWQGAWCPSLFPCTPAFACCAAGQALKVAHVTHGQLHTRRLPDCYRARHLSPRGAGLICSAPDNAAQVSILDLPSLTVRYGISPELVDSHLASSDPEFASMQPYWIEWDPAGGQTSQSHGAAAKQM